MVAGRSMVVFYSDDGLIRLQEPKWIQWTINVLIGLLRRLGLVSNVEKFNTTTC